LLACLFWVFSLFPIAEYQLTVELHAAFKVHHSKRTLENSIAISRRFWYHPSYQLAIVPIEEA
jgi:outer membrane lipopolysaccharide assembly protein LptE/RlpB